MPKPVSEKALKTWRAPGGFPPDALKLDISQPVSRVLDGLRVLRPANVTAIPLGRRLPGASSNLPGRQDQDMIPKLLASRRPYSVLLPVGFAVPPALPPARCALTAPFHPCRDKTLRAAAVCSLWHCPWARTRRMLSGTACPWSPDFPPRQPFGFAGAAVRPTDTTGMETKAAAVKGLSRARLRNGRPRDASRP